MHLSKCHAETDALKLFELARENPLAVFTTAIKSDKFSLIQSSHIPFVVDQDKQVLRAHIARANPQAKALIDAVKAQGSNTLDEEVLVLFTSAIDHYITPKFYTETKPQTGKVVPTWNYAAVQVYGKVRVYHDAKDQNSVDFLSQQIHDLSVHTEENIMGFNGKNGASEAWTVAEAPETYIALLQKAIVGIEIEIDRIEGKFKMSQESTPGDVQGVVDGLAKLGTDRASKTSELVDQRRPVKGE